MEKRGDEVVLLNSIYRIGGWCFFRVVLPKLFLKKALTTAPI